MFAVDDREKQRLEYVVVIRKVECLGALRRCFVVAARGARGLWKNMAEQDGVTWGG